MILKILSICVGAFKIAYASGSIAVIGGDKAILTAVKMRQSGIRKEITVYPTPPYTTEADMVHQLEVTLNIESLLNDGDTRSIANDKFAHQLIAPKFDITMAKGGTSYKVTSSIDREILQYASGCELKSVTMAGVDSNGAGITSINAYFSDESITPPEFAQEAKHCMDFFGRIMEIETSTGHPLNYTEYITYAIGANGESWSTLMNRVGCPNLADKFAPNKTAADAFQVLSQIHDYAPLMAALAVQAAGVSAAEFHPTSVAGAVMAYIENNDIDLPSALVELGADCYGTIRREWISQAKDMGVRISDKAVMKVGTDNGYTTVTDMHGVSKRFGKVVFASNIEILPSMLDRNSDPELFFSCKNQIVCAGAHYHATLDISRKGAGYGLLDGILAVDRGDVKKCVLNKHIVCSKGDGSLRKLYVDKDAQKMRVFGYMKTSKGSDMDTNKAKMDNFALGSLRGLDIGVGKNDMMQSTLTMDKQIRGVPGPNNIYQKMTDITNNCDHPFFIALGSGKRLAVMFRDADSVSATVRNCLDRE